MLQYQEGYQIQVHRTITYPLVQIKWIDCLWPILNEIAVYFNVYSKFMIGTQFRVNYVI